MPRTHFGTITLSSLISNPSSWTIFWPSPVIAFSNACDPENRGPNVSQSQAMRSKREEEFVPKVVVTILSTPLNVSLDTNGESGGGEGVGADRRKINTNIKHAITTKAAERIKILLFLFRREIEVEVEEVEEVAESSMSGTPSAFMLFLEDKRR